MPQYSTDPLKQKTIAIVGYGNQGRAHALNLRDSGLNVIVGARPSHRSWGTATEDGFAPVSIETACLQANLVMLLLPDTAITPVYSEFVSALKHKVIGLAHGYAYCYGGQIKESGQNAILVAPKGAGAWLRRRFEAGGGLPGAFAVAGQKQEELTLLAQAYAQGVGAVHPFLIQTTFEEETLCDLFGEQVVLCGGIPRLMEIAFQKLVEQGLSPEMAFLECCFEAKLIIDLWMQNGPQKLWEKISPTAAYGGAKRAEELLDDSFKKKVDAIWKELKGGDFAKQWNSESKDFKTPKSDPLLEKTYQKFKSMGLFS